MQYGFITAADHTGAQCDNRRLGRIVLIQTRTTRHTENLIRAVRRTDHNAFYDSSLFASNLDLYHIRQQSNLYNCILNR